MNCCGLIVFKAVLFLAAGGVLHSMADQQDMRRLGGLINLLPFTYTIILIGSLSLMAIPFMTGLTKSPVYKLHYILELSYLLYLVQPNSGYMAQIIQTSRNTIPQRLHV